MGCPYTGPFPEFEAWIRETIGGDFEWKDRPADSTASRRMIATVVRKLVREHGAFPGECYFLRRKPRRRRS